MKKYTPKPNILFYYNMFVTMSNMAIALWIIETLYFLYRDGWHYKAIHADEKMWDSIVGFGINVATLFFFLCGWAIMRSHVYHIKSEWEKENQDDEGGDNLSASV